MTRRLTITFDNGMVPGVTEGVLDVLADNDLTTTFFVVGNELDLPGRRELAERARAEGHRIGNHTLTHSVMLGTGGEPEAEREIDEAQTLFGDLAHPDRYFRPWGGGGFLDNRLLSDAAVRRLEEGGYTLVLWNCVPRDWEDATGWVDRARAEIAQLDWTVLVIHDNSRAMDELPRFLDAMRSDGVELRTDFPDACVPIRRGERTGSLDGLVMVEGGGSSL